MRLAQRSGNASEGNRLSRELDERIARFNHMVNELVVQGGILAVKAIAEIIRVIERVQSGYDEDMDDCPEECERP
jgi:hypothetical protein